MKYEEVKRILISDIEEMKLMANKYNMYSTEYIRGNIKGILAGMHIAGVITGVERLGLFDEVEHLL